MSSRIHILLSYLKYLNIKKISLYWNNYYFFYLSIVRRKALVQQYPLSISFELTNSCNLSCPHCYTGGNFGTRAKGFMDFEMFCRIIDEVSAHTHKSLLYFQGESLLHPLISDFISYAHKAGLHTYLSSNGQLLEKEVAEKIVASGLDILLLGYDGDNQDVYGKYRQGGSLEELEKGIENLENAKLNLEKKTPLVILQRLMFKGNNSVDKEKRKRTRLLGGAILQYKSLQLLDRSNKDEWLPDTKRYNRYQRRKRTIICKEPWRSAVVLWDGTLVLCCNDKNGDYASGNLKARLLKDVWQGEEMQQKRLSLLRGESFDICRNCVYGKSEL